MTILPKLSNISSIEKTKKHLSKTPSASQSSLNKFIRVRSNVNEKDTKITFSLSIACHSSICSVDHIGKIVKKLREKSVLENIDLHKTRYTAIINN